MFERNSRRVTSSAVSKANDAAISFGVDLNQDPVYLTGDVIPSRAFAQAMLALGSVVRIQRPGKKDHSQYQLWVQGEYIKMLNERRPGVLAEQSELMQKKEVLEEKRKGLLTKIDDLNKILLTKKQKYFNWLYENDREAWIVLDPIVSVQKDGTFFEAFSGDESIYARVFLPHSAMQMEEKPSLGTTNIDFSLLLEREFERVRSYRPMSLTVGLRKVEFKTEAAQVEEEKIPLPETWVRGLVEVQSVLALAPTEFEMSADALAEIIARLQSEKERHGPRSLKFMLTPGEPIRVLIEPWGDVYADDWCTYQGNTSSTIRIWGRRRLAVLSDLLVGVDRVKVHFLGSGMPSFWTVINDGVELTIGLSGWTSNDWASRAKFSSFIPTANVKEEELDKTLEFIKKSGTASSAEASKALSISVSEASAILQKLCLRGKVMFDDNRNIYRWRNLFPTLDLYKEDDSSRESRAGLKLVHDSKVQVTLDDTKNEIRYLSGLAKVENNEFNPTLELDLDNRPKYAQCNCSFYNYNKLRQGPCRHMIALLLVGDNK